MKVNFTPTGTNHYAETWENESNARQLAVVSDNVASWGTTSNKQAVWDAIKSYLENQYLFTPFDGLSEVSSTERAELPSNWIEL